MPTDTQGYDSGCKELQKLCFLFEVLEEDGIYFIWHFRVELDMLYGLFQCRDQIQLGTTIHSFLVPGLLLVSP